MKYLVTGATGFVGEHVGLQLVEAGHEVVALVRDPRSAKHLEAVGMTLARGDITDRDSLRAPMEGVDGVFHLAAWYEVGTRDAAEAERVNVSGTRNVLEVMRELGIPKGVYTSSLAVNSDTKGQIVDETYRRDGPHLSVYDRTKWRAHVEVAEPMMREGLPLVIVMPGVVYGPGDTSALGALLKQYLRGKLRAIPKRTAFCWAHVGDVARGHVLAMEKGKPGQTYMLAGPAHTLEEAFELAERITGVKAPRLRVPPAALKTASVLVRPLERLVKLPPAYTAEGLRVTAGTTYLGSNEKAKRELGYEVRSLEEGLEDTFEALNKELRGEL